MNTKEAIEILHDYIRFAEDNEQIEFEGILDLLQHGEKFEKMWEELINKKGWVFILKDLPRMFLYDVMKKLEQKYFPKEENEKYKKIKEKHYCLFCEAELDFVPTEDGGFCSTECEDSWNEA